MLGIEAPAEDGPAEVRDQVDREPAPSSRELVEHLPRPFTALAPGIFSSPSRNREDANNSSVISRGDLYSGPSSRSSIRSMASAARRSTNRAKSRGLSPTVVSCHC